MNSLEEEIQSRVGSVSRDFEEYYSMTLHKAFDRMGQLHTRLNETLESLNYDPKTFTWDSSHEYEATQEGLDSLIAREFNPEDHAHSKEVWNTYELIEQMNDVGRNLCNTSIPISKMREKEAYDALSTHLLRVGQDKTSAHNSLDPDLCHLGYFSVYDLKNYTTGVENERFRSALQNYVDENKKEAIAVYHEDFKDNVSMAFQLYDAQAERMWKEAKETANPKRSFEATGDYKGTYEAFVHIYSSHAVSMYDDGGYNRGFKNEVKVTIIDNAMETVNPFAQSLPVINWKNEKEAKNYAKDMADRVYEQASGHVDEAFADATADMSDGLTARQKVEQAQKRQREARWENNEKSDLSGEEVLNQGREQMNEERRSNNHKFKM
ncbi:MAG: hypothetical protein WC617_05125 [Rhodanobacter sp.]|jgi:hypothetical protein